MDLKNWIAERTPAFPEPFRPHLDAALRGVPGGGRVMDGLLEAALGRLGLVLTRSGRDREAAFLLLAADALLTYACEAAADGPDVEADLLAILRRTSSLSSA